MNFDELTIQQLFGKEAAEDETPERLKEYYFKNEVFEKITAKVPLRVCVGHKGIGKSALFKISMLEDIDKGDLPILIKPDDIAEISVDNQSFLLRIREWKNGLTDIIFKKVLEKVDVSNGLISPTYSNLSGKILTNLYSIFEKYLKERSNIEVSQKTIIENFLKKKTINVYIDDLDRGWQGRSEDITRVSALLNAVRDLSNENQGLYFKVSLRSDVYFLVRTSDESTDKIEGSVIWYSWTNNQILFMLVKRIMTFLEKEYNEQRMKGLHQWQVAPYLDNVFDPVFNGLGKWSNIKTYKVLMSLIRKRPRDLVKLCTLAARNAHENRQKIIRTENLRAIFEEYSQGRIQDTINEYRSELPDIERLIFGMKPSRKEKKAIEGYVYSASELKLKLNNLITNGKFHFIGSLGRKAKEANATDLLHFLYKINFLTARKELPSGKIDRKYFEESRYISGYNYDFGYDWEVHPAYRWALQPDTINEVFAKLDEYEDD